MCITWLHFFIYIKNNATETYRFLGNNITTSVYPLIIDTVQFFESHNGFSKSTLHAITDKSFNFFASATSFKKREGFGFFNMAHVLVASGDFNSFKCYHLQFTQATHKQVTVTQHNKCYA